MTTKPNTPSPVAPATGWMKKITAGKKIQGGLLFLTANTHKRIPVFKQPTPAKIFFRELEFYRSSYQFKLHGYVLMPDHFHLLLNFPAKKNFPDFLRDFKSSVGKLIIDWAKRSGRKKLLKSLQLPDKRTRYKDARYRVFQPGSYVRSVTSPSMFKQKLNYIHVNPIRANLTRRAIDYRYSSFQNYELGEGEIQLDLHDIILP